MTVSPLFFKQNIIYSVESIIVFSLTNLAEFVIYSNKFENSDTDIFLFLVS